MGVNLTGKKVAFGPIAGGCTQEFADLMMQDFVKQGLALVNRADLDAILTGHHFQVGGSVDPSAAVQLGRVGRPSW